MEIWCNIFPGCARFDRLHRAIVEVRGQGSHTLVASLMLYASFGQTATKTATNFIAPGGASSIRYRHPQSRGP